jgi:hypothetical protein
MSVEEAVAVEDATEDVTENPVDETPPIIEAPEAAKESRELVVTGGEGMAILAGGLSGLPVITKDMSISERRDAIRVILKKTLDMPDRMDVLTGELLYEVHSNEYWKDFTDKFGEDTRVYSSFEEYSEHELGIKRRKAYYLIKIYTKFVVELGLSLDILRTLEWSKACLVTEIIDADNWIEILDKLKTMSVAEIKAMVKELKGGKASEASPTGTVKRQFVLHPEQAETVDAAVKLAGTMTGSDKEGFALEMICSDFLTSSAGSGFEGALTKLEVAIKTLERAYGVKLTLESVDTVRYEALKAEAEKAAPVEPPA